MITFTAINSVIRILFTETPYKFRTIKGWLTLYRHMHVLGWYIPPASLSCVSYSIDICTVNVHAVSTNQIADILHFNDKDT